MIRRTQSLFLIVTIFALLAGCQTQPAAQSITPPTPVIRIETSTPTRSMPTTLATATLAPTIEASQASHLPAQAAGLPSQRETQVPEDCDEVYCQYPAASILSAPVTLAGQSLIDPTYPFGSTQCGTREVHLGVEFQQAHGAPVQAAAPGIVIAAGDDVRTAYGVRKNVYGNLVVVEHQFAGWEEPIFTLYAHLSSVRVSTGDEVAVGTTLGLVGASGAATGSHLHFEVRLGRNEPASAVNPLLYLVPQAGMNDAAGQIVGVIVDADDNPVYEQDLVLQAISPETDRPERNYYLETYASGVSSSDEWQENFVSGFLPAGSYRLTLVHAGRLHERLLPVEPGSVTYLKIQLGE